MKKSARLISATGLISPVPSDWWWLYWHMQGPGHLPNEQGGPPGNKNGFSVFLLKPPADITSLLTQRAHQLQKAMMNDGEYLLSLKKRPLNKNHDL